MKKTFFLIVSCVLLLSSFTTLKNLGNLDDVLKVRSWEVYCNGVYVGKISCECSDEHAQKIGDAMCNP